MATQLIFTTVAFRSCDDAAWSDFWEKIRTEYNFADHANRSPTQAFAVSMSDMFRTEEIVGLILESDLDTGEKIEAIGEVYSRGDPETVLVDWEIAESRGEAAA